MRQKKCYEVEVMLDARMIQHSGIGTYLRGLLSQYRVHPFFKEHPLGISLSPAALSQENGGARRFGFSSPIYSLQEQFEYPFRLNRCRLWHAPHYNVPLFGRTARLVVTIHDLIHWIFRKEFYSPLQAAYTYCLMTRVVRSAERIIAVSRQTRDDLIRYFDASPQKIRVIHEGVYQKFFSPPNGVERQSVLARYGLPRKFFLYVGLIKPHKNVLRLVNVFKKLWREKRIDSSLVLIGKKDRYYRGEFRALTNLQTGDGIHYLPQVEYENELPALYASALALVHPSLYEGFGLTVLEAMATGTPVIVSRAASLPEVAGDAAQYVDPRSENSLEGALLRLEGDERLRQTLSAKGREQAKIFSWQRAAEETIRVYQEVLDLK